MKRLVIVVVILGAVVMFGDLVSQPMTIRMSFMKTFTILSAIVGNGFGHCGIRDRWLQRCSPKQSKPERPGVSTEFIRVSNVAKCSGTGRSCPHTTNFAAQ